jgi:beta-galactosidase
MSFIKWILISIVSMYLTVETVCAQKTRVVENFDFGWKFHLGDAPEAQNASFNDADWRDIQLPHDFSLEQGLKDDGTLGANGFFPGGIGWYRKTFTIPKGYAGKKVSICFDGVYHRSDVWLNGQHLGFRPYGYVGFEYDLTPYLISGGNNVLSVRADHSNVSSSRWYSGSGIYRHVTLKAVDPVHIDLWGVYITTPQITPQEGIVQIETTVKNDGQKAQQVQLETAIYSPKGIKVGAANQTIRIDAANQGTFKQNIAVKLPVLWDLETPELYTAITKIKAGSSVDEVKTNFGFRTLEWDTQKGFFLNGKNLKLKGVNLHHDGGVAVGAAVPERIWEMRLTRLKDIGVNFIRTSHNPTAPEFMDLCDRIGILVQDEAFDKWKGNYYGEYYDEWWQTDLQSMLQRDRNHPSVILWSVGNEVYEQGKLEGAEMLEKMVDFVHQYENSRKVTVGMVSSTGAENPNNYGFADKVDIAGHNYNELYYETDKKNHPDRIILGTENYLYYRGETSDNMHFEDARHTWMDVVEHDYVAGWALWPGIDYIGETTRFAIKGWCTGIMDMSGREKTIAGLYRAFWKDTPQLEIAVLDDALDIDPGTMNSISINWSAPKMAGHWNFPLFKDNLIRVHTFSNCDSVALWVNNRSLGKRAVSDYNNKTIPWIAPYAEGTLKAVGYHAGKEVIAKELRTAGNPAEIALNSLYPSVKADGQDVALVEVFLKDKDGNFVQHDDRKITITVKGAGSFVGMDNGDLRLKEPIRTNRLSTYFGRCLVVVRAGQTAGDIIITAESEELPTASVLVPAVGMKHIK